MLQESDIVKGDLTSNVDEAWNMRKVMWRIYDLSMEHFDKVKEVPGWKMKFVRSKAQALTFYREGQHKDLGPIIRDLEEKEDLFRDTIFEPYMNAMLAVAIAGPEKFVKQGGGKWDE
jgi:hypothetical protein